MVKAKNIGFCSVSEKRKRKTFCNRKDDVATFGWFTVFLGFFFAVLSVIFNPAYLVIVASSVSVFVLSFVWKYFSSGKSFEGLLLSRFAVLSLSWFVILFVFALTLK